MLSYSNNCITGTSSMGLQELLGNKKSYSYLLVHQSVYSDTHMSRLLRTRVHISVVFSKQIDVMKNEAMKVVDFQRFLKSDVEKHRPVEGAVSVLPDDKNGVVQQLSP